MATRPSGRRTALAYETKNATVGLEPVEQLCCVCLLCQSAEHHACHGRVEEHFACFDQALEIAAHAPVPPEPSQCSLHHPPALEHVKATRDLWGLLAWGEPHAVQTRPPVFADRQRPAQ